LETSSAPALSAEGAGIGDRRGPPTGPSRPFSERFHLAPPRRFVLPALLLLLSERPSYGYALTRRLQELSFGHADRPAVYRGLAQLETDGLVTSSSEDPTAGSARRVYRVTPLGEEVLSVWMGVIKEEHASLTRVLHRYQATGRADALIAEVGGGWAAALGPAWPPVVPVPARRHLLSLLTEDDRDAPGVMVAAASLQGAPDEKPTLHTFNLVGERSVVLIEARSTVGPISFGALGLRGWVRASLSGGTLAAEPPPEAHLEFDVKGLSSGNSVYDAELLRRVDADRFPTAAIDLTSSSRISRASYRVSGLVSFHGSSRLAEGTVRLEVDAGSGRLVVEGEEPFDMRDFSISVPAVLMLRIFPDVKALLHVEAELAPAAEASGTANIGGETTSWGTGNASATVGSFGR
jgi:PadR family transcriptional regulator PadR